MAPEPSAAWVERIVETYSTTLLRVAMQQMKHKTDAEDVVQTVFLKLLRAKPNFASSDHEKAWLLRVTINACHDAQRMAHRKRHSSLDDGLYMETTPAKDTSQKDIEVLEAVRGLDEKYSTIVYLYYYEGYTTAEIAKLLGTQKGTVDSRLFRARQKLRTTLEGGWD